MKDLVLVSLALGLVMVLYSIPATGMGSLILITLVVAVVAETF